MMLSRAFSNLRKDNLKDCGLLLYKSTETRRVRWISVGLLTIGLYNYGLFFTGRDDDLLIPEFLIGSIAWGCLIAFNAKKGRTPRQISLENGRLRIKLHKTMGFRSRSIHLDAKDAVYKYHPRLKTQILKYTTEKGKRKTIFLRRKDVIRPEALKQCVGTH
jgi:hypothetical protein